MGAEKTAVLLPRSLQSSISTRTGLNQWCRQSVVGVGIVSCEQIIMQFLYTNVKDTGIFGAKISFFPGKEKSRMFLTILNHL